MLSELASILDEYLEVPRRVANAIGRTIRGLGRTVGMTGGFTPADERTVSAMEDEIRLMARKNIRPLFRPADTWGVMVLPESTVDQYDLNKVSRNLDLAFRHRAIENGWHGGFRKWTGERRLTEKTGERTT